MMKALSKIVTGMLLAALSLCMQHSWGQQDPMYSQYMFNTLSINPAYAGSADFFAATAIYRTQWVGLDGAPVTQTVTAHAPLKWESISLGGSVVNDSHGPVDQLAIYFDASYRLFLGKRKLAFGLKGGVNLLQADLVSLNPLDGSDDVFQQNVSNRALPNFGTGVLYYGERFYIGLSAPKLLENKFFEGSGPLIENSVEQQHYFLIAGHVFDLNPYLRFKPSVLAKVTQGAPPSLDVTANFLFYDKFWAGAMYRWEDSAGILLQYEINHKFRLGYAFDYTLSDLVDYNSGTHEIMLGFDLRDGVRPDVSPRFF